MVELSMVRMRMSRVDQLIREGNKQAVLVKKIISNISPYLSACQLGITMVSLGLGWLGEATVEHVLHPVVELFGLSDSVTTLVSLISAFAIITFLHVVLGEIVPKTIAISTSESLALKVARPIEIFRQVTYPFIWLLSTTANGIVRMLGFKNKSEHDEVHSEEELRVLLAESYQSGQINQAEFKYVDNIFRFDNRLAREIMVPRKEMIAVETNHRISTVLNMVKEQKFTRFPVIDGDKDTVLGVINLKEIFTDIFASANKDYDTPIEEYIRPVIRVIESIPIQDLLVKMQKERIHMAILMDEYGGTSGLVTVEDILEEIVGEIRDEFDEDETPMIQKMTKERTIVDGKVLLTEISDLFNLSIDDPSIDTIGGWLLTQKHDVVENDMVEAGGYTFKVLELDGHQIKEIEIIKKGVVTIDSALEEIVSASADGIAANQK